MYMRDAEVRIFLPASPIGGPERTWADAALAYVDAFVLTQLSILCLAISQNADLQEGSPWHPHRDLFMGTLLDRYVNVVIGVNPTRSFGDSCMPELERLFTVGVPNVAIIGDGPRALDETERMALKNYDLIIVPTEEDLDGVVAQVPGHPLIVCLFATSVAALGDLMRGILATPPTFAGDAIALENYMRNLLTATKR
jgi:hypothetical protein